MEIKTYLSPLGCGKTIVRKLDNTISQRKKETTNKTPGIELEVYLMPLSDTLGQVITYLFKEGTDPYEILTYKGIITIAADDNNKPYYKITVQNPTINLDKWIKTSIVIFGPGCSEKPRLWKEPIERTSGNGPIPESHDDFVTPKGPFEFPFTQNSIVPGEKACARWEFKDGDAIIHTVNNKELGVYWKTLNLTGGFIKEKVGDYDTKDLIFNVEIEGVLENCRPSDYVKWEVGDYVFVAKTGLDYFIIPIKINEAGA